MSPIGRNCTTRGPAVLPLALLLLIALAAPACAASVQTRPVRELPVTPLYTWDAANEQVIMHTPREVSAWLEGAEQDPDGVLADWYARWKEQANDPVHAVRLAMLQAAVRREARERSLTAFQIQHELIPALLARQATGAAASPEAGDALPFEAPARCYRVQFGRFSCFQWGDVGCLNGRCDPAGQGSSDCHTHEEIACPEDNVDDRY